MARKLNRCKIPVLVDSAPCYSSKLTKIPTAQLETEAQKTPWYLDFTQESRKQDHFSACDKVLAVVYASQLRSCSDLRTLFHGQRIHAQLITRGHIHEVFLGNLLIQMYGSCGAMAEAASVFNNMPKKNVFSWNLLIGAYVQNEQGSPVPPLYHFMHLQGILPDQVTLVSALSTCSGPQDLVEGKIIHINMQYLGIECNVVSGTAILNMYAKCGSLGNAVKMFDQIDEKNVVSWNAMLAAYFQHGKHKQGFQLFQHMMTEAILPNKVTFITLLPACTCHANLAEGLRMHVMVLHDVIDSDVKLENALLDMLGTCGAMELASSHFSSMAERDVISWNILTEAYVLHGQNEEAFYLFKQMQAEGILPDDVSYISMLSACVHDSLLTEGKRLHSHLLFGNFMPHVIAETALVNMYSKCGNISQARHTFEDMLEKNVISWNAMVGAYAQHGLSKHCFQTFGRMLMESVRPTNWTYFSILSVCSHGGLVEEGHFWFDVMVHTHCVEPTVEHFNCLIDLLGRSGQLDGGEALLNSTLFQANAASWAALLGNCKIHSDIERGILIIEHVIRMNPNNAAPHVSMANIYAAAGMWEEANKIHQTRKDSTNNVIDVIGYEYDLSGEELLMTGNLI